MFGTLCFQYWIIELGPQVRSCHFLDVAVGGVTGSPRPSVLHSDLTPIQVTFSRDAVPMFQGLIELEPLWRRLSRLQPFPSFPTYYACVVPPELDLVLLTGRKAAPR